MNLLPEQFWVLKEDCTPPSANARHKQKTKLVVILFYYFFGRSGSICKTEVFLISCVHKNVIGIISRNWNGPPKDHVVHFKLNYRRGN